MEQLSQLKIHPVAQPTRPTGDALNLSVRRTNFMCVFMYFLDLSMHKRLCLGSIEGLLIILLIKAILTRTRLVVVFAIFGSPEFLKIILLVSRGIPNARFFSIDSCIALTLILNPRDQNEVSSLEDFSKIFPLSLHGESFFHQLIYSFCLTLFLLK